MDASRLHADAVVFDGLIISNWGRPVFEAMHAGGLTAANCTASWPYRRGPETFRDLARWRGWFEQHDDIILQVRTAADFRRAKEAGKVGIVLGFQDTSHFDDHLPFVGLMKDLGVGVVQMTYNTANAVGCGCFESRDGGLTDFGREVLAEMNRVGIAADLSHVGAKTADDVVEASAKPVTYSHVAPSALLDHPRNKSDAAMRKVAERGGLIGVTPYPPFQARGPESQLDDFLDAVEHCIGVAGEEHIGVGTDFTQGYETDAAFWRQLLRDKGHARELAPMPELIYPDELQGLQDFPNVTAAMVRRGWSETRIRRVMGENWVRFLGDVWA